MGTSSCRRMKLWINLPKMDQKKIQYELSIRRKRSLPLPCCCWKAKAKAKVETWTSPQQQQQQLRLDSSNESEVNPKEIDIYGASTTSTVFLSSVFGWRFSLC